MPPVREKGPIHPWFGHKVWWWREKNGLGVNELGRKAGVSPSLISAYELLHTNPKYGKACKVAHALGIHVSVLWDHTPPPDYDVRPTSKPRK